MFTLNCKGRLLVIDRPIVMGIINITPDSFYAGSRRQNKDDILRNAEKMITEGATILDMGAQSTRPSSELLTADEELQRMGDLIYQVHQNFPEIILSIDSFYSSVASEAVAQGASIVNDISAGNMDEYMIPTVASLRVPYVCMHMKGTPQTMLQHSTYENVTSEVIDFFIQRIDLCKKAGINDVIIDPGFGFAKTIDHNFSLLKNLKAFSILQKPLLLGISRKSTIYKTLGITADEALNGTTVLNTVGLMNGANILRVHDVKEAVEAIRLISKLAD